MDLALGKGLPLGATSSGSALKEPCEEVSEGDATSQATHDSPTVCLRNPFSPKKEVSTLPHSVEGTNTYRCTVSNTQKLQRMTQNRRDVIMKTLLRAIKRFFIWRIDQLKKKSDYDQINWELTMDKICEELANSLRREREAKVGQVEEQ